MKKLASMIFSFTLIFFLILPTAATSKQAVIDIDAMSQVSSPITLEDVTAGVTTLDAYNAQLSYASNVNAADTSAIQSSSQVIPNGVHYLNNVYMGDYISITSGNTATLVSGPLSFLGNYIKWTITYTSEGYLIQSVIDPTQYLSVLILGSTKYADVYQASAGTTLPAYCY